MTKQSNEAQRTVLMFHSRYRTLGGEEGSFEQEAALFTNMGYKVVRFETRNDEVGSGPRAAFNAIFNPKVFRRAHVAIRKHRPSIVYVNNLWPSLSPAVLWAARFNRVPTLQALRNYRITCPSAKLTNSGSCLSCGSNRYPVSCIVNGCYNNSRIQSLVVALFSLAMRLSNTARTRHRYLATSKMTKDLLVKGGLSRHQVRVRPNFLAATAAPSFEPGRGVIYVGRLSAEKGVAELVTEWLKLDHPPTLTLVGEGPLAEFVAKAAAQEDSAIVWLGSCSPPKVLEEIRKNALVIVPSQWAEPFGRVAIEAMSVGTPVIHTEGGALREIVGDTGVFLAEISASALNEALLLLHDPSTLMTLSKKAYSRYTHLYSPEAAKKDMLSHIASVSS